MDTILMRKPVGDGRALEAKACELIKEEQILDAEALFEGFEGLRPDYYSGLGSISKTIAGEKKQLSKGEVKTVKKLSQF